tara:strand:+ start:40 stop:315 length:276 start_codon:yes stop_codon:yes gene_type:complete
LTDRKADAINSIFLLKNVTKKTIVNKMRLFIKANFVSTSNLFKLLYGMRKWLAKELKADENVNIIMIFINCLSGYLRIKRINNISATKAVR